MTHKSQTPRIPLCNYVASAVPTLVYYCNFEKAVRNVWPHLSWGFAADVSYYYVMYHILLTFVQKRDKIDEQSIYQILTFYGRQILF